MTKKEEFVKTAREAVDIWAEDKYLFNRPNDLAMKKIFDRVASALQKAVETEREECAKVAEKYLTRTQELIKSKVVGDFCFICGMPTTKEPFLEVIQAIRQRQKGQL